MSEICLGHEAKTNFAAGNKTSRVTKLGNSGEACTHQMFLGTCFLVLPGL